MGPTLKKKQHHNRSVKKCRRFAAHHDYDFESQITQDNKLDIFTAAAQYESSNDVVPFHFKSPEKFDKIEAINLMGFYGRAALASTRRVHYERYIEINAKLLKELSKEYHVR